MTTKRIYDFQLTSLATGVAIRAAGGVCYVASAGASAKVTITDPDNGFAALSNPVALTNGRIRFATEKAIESVDIYVLCPGGEFVILDGAAPGATPEIMVDTNQRNQVYVIPFDIADTTAATETDTGFDLPEDAFVLGMGAGVIVDTVDATETIDVGLRAGESGGDADGFMTTVLVSVAGFVKATVVAAGETLGVMLSIADETAGFRAEGHRGDGTAESITYTLTAGTDTAVGKIVLPVQLANM
jgi:hypothetical protein